MIVNNCIVVRADHESDAIMHYIDLAVEGVRRCGALTGRSKAGGRRQESRL